MMSVIFIVCLMLIILCVWRRFHQKLAEQRFTYRVFELRDKLRLSAIDGVIDCNHWYFKYIDRSFSYAIQDAYYLTLLRILLRGHRVQEDDKYLEFKKKLTIAVKEHPEVGELVNQYRRALHDYLIEQHYIGYTVFVKPLFSLFVGAKSARDKLIEAIKTTLYITREDRNSHEVMPI